MNPTKTSALVFKSYYYHSRSPAFLARPQLSKCRRNGRENFFQPPRLHVKQSRTAVGKFTKVEWGRTEEITIEHLLKSGPGESVEILLCVTLLFCLPQSKSDSRWDSSEKLRRIPLHVDSEVSSYDCSGESSPKKVFVVGLLQSYRWHQLSGNFPALGEVSCGCSLWRAVCAFTWE